VAAHPHSVQTRGEGKGIRFTARLQAVNTASCPARDQRWPIPKEGSGAAGHRPEDRAARGEGSDSRVFDAPYGRVLNRAKGTPAGPKQARQNTITIGEKRALCAKAPQAKPRPRPASLHRQETAGTPNDTTKRTNQNTKGRAKPAKPPPPNRPPPGPGVLDTSRPEPGGPGRPDG